MKRILYYEIAASEDGCTVRDFLQQRGYSHAVLVQLKKTNRAIVVNGTWYYVNDRLHAGDRLQITIEETGFSNGIVPAPLPLSIVYEDDDILIVDKPANMPVHPSLKNYDNTLANAAVYYFQSQGVPFTFRCVNRLDRDTTGLTILAKHMLSGAVLARQMKEREIHRTYLAIVSGKTPDFGTIDAPIARKCGSAIEREVNFSTGERAVTNFKRLAFYDGLSLLAVTLETGRTHQIRVHMKHIGYPLIGDFLYNPDFDKIKRQALHSYQLDFFHPITGEACSYRVPLPNDMAKLFPDFLT